MELDVGAIQQIRETIGDRPPSSHDEPGVRQFLLYRRQQVRNEVGQRLDIRFPAQRTHEQHFATAKPVSDNCVGHIDTIRYDVHPPAKLRGDMVDVFRLRYGNRGKATW
jgi:hypothetical protein